MTPLLLFGALLLVAGVNAALGAYATASRIWLRYRGDGDGLGARVATHVLEEPHRVTLAAGAAVSAAAFTTGALVADLGDAAYLECGTVGCVPSPWEVPVRVLLWAVVFVLVGQLLPRAIGRRWPTALALLTAPLMAALIDLARPVRWLVTPLVSPLKRRRAGRLSDDEELAAVLREGELEGVGRKDELALISGVVQFADTTVGEVMTSRADIFGIDAAMAPAEAATRIAGAAYSRVPVYRDTLDDVTGMILAFDVLKGDGASLPALRPVAEATVGERCKVLLSRMLRSRRHFCVVRDGDGAVAGIVTLEDLIEELVGDIRDEHDEPPARPGGASGD